ncbi:MULTISPECIES: TonB-dependent receptor [unclassified Tardiphaga]|uniref:TonB-dependent receptor n=1 Tax=unclassified Tardiphaga TaxID=2631404 RepID=UPI00143E0B46|nr:MULTISPECIES: TonB-dependent siderophore receptor [unclassified Tardiphaga]
MLIPSSADAQAAPPSTPQELPPVRITAPQRQAAKPRPAQRGAASTLPRPVAAAAPRGAVASPIIGDGAGISGYMTPSQAGVSRYSVPLRDVPQTVNVVSQQLMQDQRTTSVVEALRNVPGITFTAGEGGVQGDQINIRGYTARNDIYRDGIRDPGWYARDAFSFDRVEVYKGPSSFAFGRGSTGGVINIVSKLPQARDFYVVEGTGTSAAGGRATVDVNKTLGDWAVRLSALAYETDTAGRGFANTKRYGFAPSISYQINDKAKNTLSYIYQKDDNIADRGIPMLPGSYFGTSYRQPAPVPRNTYYGVATPGQDDVEKTEAHNLINKFEYDVVPGLKFTNTTGYSYVDRFNRTRPVQLSNLNTATSNLWNAPSGGTQLATPGNPLTSATPLSSIWIANTNHFQNQTNNELISNVSDLNAKFATGFLEHNVLAGVEVSHENREQYRSEFGDGYRVNVAAPKPYVSGALDPRTGATLSRSDTVGVYIQDQIKVTEWLELLGGVRFDNFEANTRAYSFDRGTGAVVSSGTFVNGRAIAAPTNLSSNNSFVTYRAGAVLHPTPNSSVYYMHGTSANPPAEFLTTTNGQQSLAPVLSETDEIGTKIDLLNNRLNVNAAVFRTKKTGDYESVSTSPPAYVAIGDSQVTGFEIGASGKLTDLWSIYGGYAYLKSELVSSLTTANIGHELANTPQNSFSIWSTYDVTPLFTLGGGAVFVDSRWTSVANDARVPSYWRFDAMAAYKVTKNFKLQLNIYNLTDEYYFDSLAGAGYAIPGQGRYVSLSGRASF